MVSVHTCHAPSLNHSNISPAQGVVLVALGHGEVVRVGPALLGVAHGLAPKHFFFCFFRP